MAVAKSYENMEIHGEPFVEENKMYVYVVGPCKRCGGSGHYSYNEVYGTICFRCNGSGREKMKVRWYTDKQREALDRAAEKRNAAKAVKVEERRVKFAARNAFGFGEAGFITLLKGDQNVINEWAHETDPCRARYNTMFGWFCPSTLAIENLPDGVELVRLDWDKVADESDSEHLSIKDEADVKAAIRELVGEPESQSEYQGEINDWLEEKVVIKRNIAVDNRYGSTHMHIMEDERGNIYLWSTASKDLPESSEYNMRMKVKDHKEYNGEKQTIVYYCKIK